MQEQNSQAEANPAEELKTQAKNFANLRKAVENSQQENLQLKQELAQLKEAMKKVPAKEEYDSNEPYVDHNKFRKELDSFKESMASEIDKKAEAKARDLILQERRNDYLSRNKDFYEVMQEDSLQKFVNDHPNLASSFSGLPDSFERQQALYEAIKTINGLKTTQSAAPAPVKRSPLEAAMESRKAAIAYQPGGAAPGPFQTMGDFSQSGMKNAYERFKSLQKTVNV